MLTTNFNDIKDWNDAKYILIPLLIFNFVVFFSGALSNYYAYKSSISFDEINSFNCRGRNANADIKQRTINFYGDKEYQVDLVSVKQFNRFLNYCSYQETLKIKYALRVKNLATLYNSILEIEGFDLKQESFENIKKTNEKLFRDTSVVSAISFILIMFFVKINLPNRKSSNKIRLYGKTPIINNLLVVLVMPVLIYFNYLSSYESLFFPILIVGGYLWVRGLIDLFHITSVYKLDGMMIINHMGPFGGRVTFNKDDVSFIKFTKRYVRGTKEQLLAYIELKAISKDGNARVIGYTTDEKSAKRVDILFNTLKRNKKINKTKKRSRRGY